MTYLAESWKRWLVWLVLVVVFAASCVFLSEWQFERRAARVVEIELVQQNFDKPAVAIATVDLVAKQSKWTPVRVVGEYLNESQVLVRNRPRSGQPGFETVVAFRTVDGQTFAVSRGWLPTGNLQDSPDVLPLPSEKTQEIVARLVPGERQLDRGAPDGQVASMNLAEIAAETGLQINQQWYLRLASEQEPAEQAVKLLKPTTERAITPRMRFSGSFSVHSRLSRWSSPFAKSMTSIDRRTTRLTFRRCARKRVRSRTKNSKIRSPEPGLRKRDQVQVAVVPNVFNAVWQNQHSLWVQSRHSTLIVRNKHDSTRERGESAQNLFAASRI